MRRMVTLVFCGLAFWAGMKVMQLRHDEACRAAGGTLRGETLCIGVQR